MNISEENNQRRENIQVGNIGFYIPFVEKLKLYQTFFTKGLLWTKNKGRYWQFEKAILEWAWSDHHQHLARNITTQRLFEAFGITRTKTNLGITVSQDRPVEIITKNKKELVEEVFNTQGAILEPVMGNLAIKGFAEPVTYSDLTGDKSIHAVHSVIINVQGLLAGEVAHEEQTGGTWKYKSTILFIYHLLVLSLLAAVFLLLDQVFGIKPSIGINSFLSSIIDNSSPLLMSLLVISYILFVWTRV